MAWFQKNKSPPPVNRLQIQLNKAAQNLDLVGLRQALLAGADPNGSPQASISPLVLAGVSIQGWLSATGDRQKEAMLALLDAGARPDWGGNDGQHPFEIALRNGWVEVIEKMLSRNQDPNKVNQGGPTPLQVVMSVGEYLRWPLVPVIECLLGAGADASRSSRQQPIPLVLGLRNPNLMSADDLEKALIILAKDGGVPSELKEELSEHARERGLLDLAAEIDQL